MEFLQEQTRAEVQHQDEQSAEQPQPAHVLGHPPGSFA